MIRKIFGLIKWIILIIIGIIVVVVAFACGGTTVTALPLPMNGMMLSEPSEEALAAMQNEIDKYIEIIKPLEDKIESEAKAAVKNKWGVDLSMEDGVRIDKYTITKTTVKLVPDENGIYDADGTHNPINGQYKQVAESETVGTLYLNVSIPDWAYLMCAESVINEQNQYKIDFDMMKREILENTRINIDSGETTITVTATFDKSLEEYVKSRTGGNENYAQIARYMYSNLTQVINVNSSIIMGNSGNMAGVVVNPNLPYDGTIGSLIVQYAQAQLGLPYSQGGNRTTTHRDCSSMVKEACNKAGVPICDVSASQAQWCKDNDKIIARSDLQPGDLIFWARNGRVYHVGIYAGDGMIIDASSNRNAVVYRELWGEEQIVLCARPY